MSKLRTFLQRERTKRGWSLTDLSDKSGIAMANLSRWENAKKATRPSYENILALGRVFDMDPSEVMRFIGFPRHKFANGAERDAEWGKLREMLESDPRAKRILELYDRSGSEDDKDRAVDLLEVHFRNHSRPRPE